MKTTQALATAILAVFLVFAPAAVFAATTVTVTMGSPSYSGTATIGVSGSVTPTPTIQTT